jgi:hypothetical protein
VKDSFYKGLVFSLVISHLFFVTLGACYISIPDWVFGKNIIDLYQQASGSSSNYGFFAPSIGGKTRALFDIVNDKGQKVENLKLLSMPGREVQLRLSGLYDEFAGTVNDKFRQKLAASLAASMFSGHADAVEVTLHIQEFWPKTMDEYRRGMRADWSDYYTARFVRAGAKE